MNMIREYKPEDLSKYSVNHSIADNSMSMDISGIPQVKSNLRKSEQV